MQPVNLQYFRAVIAEKLSRELNLHNFLQLNSIHRLFILLKKHSHGCQIWVRFAKIRTNLLFSSNQIQVLSHLGARRAKSDWNMIRKIPDLSHLGPNCPTLGPNLATLICVRVCDRKERPPDETCQVYNQLLFYFPI